MGISSSFKGFDSVYAAMRMSISMVIKLLLALFVIQAVIISAVIYFNGSSIYGNFDDTDKCILSRYFICKVQLKLHPVNDDFLIDYKCEGRDVKISYKQFMATFGDYINKRIVLIKQKTTELFLWTCLLYLLFPMILYLLNKKHKKDVEDKFIRGAHLLKPEELSKLLKQRTGSEVSFKITENISVPMSITSRHTFVIGKPGSGKTQLIGRIIEQIVKLGYKCIIHDFKGDFISTFYDHKKHYIFNPLDKRHVGLKDYEMDLIDVVGSMKMAELSDEYFSILENRYKNIKEKPREITKADTVLKAIPYTDLLDMVVEICSKIKADSKYATLVGSVKRDKNLKKGWSIYNELKLTVDVDAFCASLITDSSSQDNFWPVSSRQLLGAMITYCLYHGKTTYKELWEVVNMKNTDLLELFKVTPGCEEGMKLLAEDKTANNIMAVLSGSTKPIKYLIGTDGDFSIKEWVRNESDPKRVIFLSNYSMIQETIKPFLTLFVDFATKTLCSMEDDLSRRLFFVLDEFGQLSKIGSIIQLLTQSRSKGGAAYLLIQDVAQINSTYNKEGSTSIVNSCGNTISFAVSDESTADFISKKIGTKEVERTSQSKNLSVDDMKDGFGISTQMTETRLVMPSEVQNLPTMNCFFQLTDFPVSRDKLAYIKFPINTKAFVERDDLDIKKGSGNGSAKVPGVSELSGKGRSEDSLSHQTKINSEPADIEKKINNADDFFNDCTKVFTHVDRKTAANFGSLEPEGLEFAAGIAPSLKTSNTKPIVGHNEF
jgi:type IV secretory pathway TraG/TraD family ATPase VirD4